MSRQNGLAIIVLQAHIILAVFVPSTPALQQPRAASTPVNDAPTSNCTCIPSAKDADLITALSWVCGPGKVDCSAINPGGSHFNPNDAVDHANYAFNKFYQAHKSDGYETCFFGGNAYLKPPPAGAPPGIHMRWS